MSITPPSDSVYGFVTCRIIRRVADSTDDDDFPDAVAASGSVIFKPQVSISKVDSPSAFAVKETITAKLDGNGQLISPGNPTLLGVWLLAGVYSVTFQLNNATLPSMTIEVTTDHTLEAPLDLVTAAEYTPPSGVTVQTLVIPSTVTTGQVLLLDDTRTLVGVPFSALDVDAAANAEASAEVAIKKAGIASSAATAAETAASNAAKSESNAASSAGIAHAAAESVDRQLVTATAGSIPGTLLLSFPAMSAGPYPHTVMIPIGE